MVSDDHASSGEIVKNVSNLDDLSADDLRLAELGYRSEFKREFSVWRLAYIVRIKFDIFVNAAACRDHCVLVLDHGGDWWRIIYIFLSSCFR